MNAGQSLTSHVADPENIIVINASLTNPAWLLANAAYLAKNIIPNPTIPNYYVVDLNLVSSTSAAIVFEWLSANNSLISFPDSYSYIVLGHQLNETVYQEQIDEAIAKSIYYKASGEDLTLLHSSFDASNYPNYFEVKTDESGNPDVVDCVTSITNSDFCYSFSLFKAIFKAFDVAVSDRKDVVFYFAKIVNTTTDVEGVGIKMEYGTMTAYYDFSGGQPPIDPNRTISCCLK